MKHLVIALMPTVIGAESFITQAYVGTSDKVNGVVELPSGKTGRLREWEYLDDDLLTARFERVDSIKTNGKPNPWNLTIHEFVTGPFGVLTALFFDEAGKFKRKQTWEYVRG